MATKHVKESNRDKLERIERALKTAIIMYEAMSDEDLVTEERMVRDALVDTRNLLKEARG